MRKINIFVVGLIIVARLTRQVDVLKFSSIDCCETSAFLLFYREFFDAIV